ncbi:MAG: DUF554 domain-containing protein [Propionibacteriaceae bacterium]|jgi:uncharacterized membrane protein YqgA involved in biofilm formation|nr:DUF554 domain-containing protein [Propionibacteriaceae bacterium]
MFPGIGTVINVVAIAAGCGLGLLMGHRFPERTRSLVTVALGLFTLVIAGSSIAGGLSPALSDQVGPNAPLLVVLSALLVGGIIGSLIRIEDRLDGLAEKVRARVAAREQGSRFVEGAVTSTLIFCVGPLAILGSLSDGLGDGPQQLLVKSLMDGFAATAFAATFGVGVVASIIPVALYQGLLTLLGAAAGSFLSPGEIDALTATGGVILLGLGIRLIGLKPVPVGDLLPALVLAPAFTALVGALV